MFQPGFKVIHQNEFYDENEDEFDVNFEHEVGFSVGNSQYARASVPS